MLSSTQARILKTLQQAEEALSLHDIDPALGIEKPTAYRNLKALAEAGLVERTGEHKAARYRPHPHLDVRWQDQVLDPQGNPDWLYHEWRMDGKVDWRFPLVSRLPDTDGRAAALLFLDHAYRQGALLPQGKVEDLTLVAYGSCVRGDAGPDSDLDLITFLHGKVSKKVLREQEARFYDLVDDIAHPPRPISIVVQPWHRVTDDDRPAVFYNIQRDGLTVFSSRAAPPFIETWRHRDAP